MYVVDMDAATLANVRIAPSPAVEVVEWLWHATAGRRHPRFGDTGTAARAALSHPDVALVAEVLPRSGSGYVPDLLTPMPEVAEPSHTWTQQLEEMAATPAEMAALQVDRVRFRSSKSPTRVLAAVDAGTFAARAANGLWVYWRAALVDQWNSLRSALEADIARRATTMARSGTGAMLNSLHSGIMWHAGRLLMDKPQHDTFQLTNGELVLVPTVLGWPAIALQVTSPRNAMVMYPASANNARPPRHSVPRLVGRSRAAILDDLDVPRSTGELSQRHGLSPATVSYHLGVLLRAGVVTRFRQGALVFYRRNSTGDCLLDADHARIA